MVQIKESMDPGRLSCLCATAALSELEQSNFDTECTNICARFI